MATTQQSFVTQCIYIAADGLWGYVKSFCELVDGTKTIKIGRASGRERVKDTEGAVESKKKKKKTDKKSN